MSAIESICKDMIECISKLQTLRVSDADITVFDKDEVMKRMKGMNKDSVVEYNNQMKNELNELQFKRVHYENELDKMKNRMNELTQYLSVINSNIKNKDKLIEYYHYQHIKDKWDIDIYSMMIIGKYFDNNNDFINIMKLCKKYQQLTSMYHYNPISECELFGNIETQFFYKEQDRNNKKGNLNSYIYFYNIDNQMRRSLEANESIKDYYYHKMDNHILMNIHKLEEWSGHSYDKVVYDSDIDGKEVEVFRSRVVNHQHLYFIVIDSDNNVFGHYHDSLLDKLTEFNYDSNMFMFTLCRNGVTETNKYNNKAQDIWTFTYGGTYYYFCGRGALNKSSYGVGVVDNNVSSVKRANLIKTFDEIKKDTLTGRTKGNKFITRRLVVIEMK